MQHKGASSNDPAALRRELTGGEHARSSLTALRERNNLCAAQCLTPRPAPQISEGLQVLPGVEALLVALAARANCVTGLVRLVRVRRR